jgi:hypothetical protein
MATKQGDEVARAKMVFTRARGGKWPFRRIFPAPPQTSGSESGRILRALALLVFFRAIYTSFILSSVCNRLRPSTAYGRP